MGAAPPLQHGLFQGAVRPQQPRKRLHKPLGVDLLEGSVDKPIEDCQVGRFVLEHKLAWGVVHPLHQRVQAFQDGHAVAPRQRGGEKRRHLLVLPTGEAMGNGQRIVRNEIRHLVLLRLLQQKLLDVLGCHGAKIGLNSRCVGKA